MLRGPLHLEQCQAHITTAAAIDTVADPPLRKILDRYDEVIELAAIFQ